MFDRVDHPAQGRRGGHAGAPTTIKRDDGVQMKGKGKQFVPEGRKVLLSFPGGAGYGDPEKRDHALIKDDLIKGYISLAQAQADYGLNRHQILQLIGDDNET